MKKIFTTALIFISISIFFVPQTVKAEPLGTCYYKAVNKTTNAVREYDLDGQAERFCQVGTTTDNGTEIITVVRFDNNGQQSLSDAIAGTKNDVNNPGYLMGIFRKVIGSIGTLLLQVTGLIVGLAGAILNGVIYHTIVNISENYNNLGPIFETWKIIRDLANMCFIFILVYAGIMTMVGKGGDNKKLIINVIVAAVLMNFSIFFTRVVIDMANLLALTFYEAIVPSTAGSGFMSWGLSNAFMQHLNLSSFWKLSQTQTVSWDTILTVGIMGSAMLLVAAFVFAAISILLIIRYVVLILVIILSPIYFLSLALPKGTKIDSYGEQWEAALFNQAFFAPVYFFLTWVALRIMDGVFVVFKLNEKILSSDAALSGIAVAKTPTAGTLLMIINFGIVIVLIIASLTTSKQMADKAGGGMSGLTSWATGKAGSLTFGAAGAFGRNSLGRAGQLLGQSERLKNMAANGNIATRFAARQALQQSRKVGASSFDFRASRAGGAALGKVGGEAGGRGGFAASVEAGIGREEKFAKTLGPSDRAKAKARLTLERVRKEHDEDSDEVRTAQHIVDSMGGVNLETMKKREGDALARAAESDETIQRARTLENEAAQAEQDLTSNDEVLGNEERIAAVLQKKKEELASSTLFDPTGSRQSDIAALEGKLEEAKKASAIRRQEISNAVAAKKKEATDARAEATKREAEIKKNYRNEKGELITYQNAAEQRKEEFAKSVEDSKIAWAGGYNYEAASKIRGNKKSSTDKAVDELKKAIKEDEAPASDSTTPPITLPVTPPTPPPSAPPPAQRLTS